MCAFSVRTLFAVAAAVLLSSDLSCASPTQPANWPNQPGLYIERWHPVGENGMRTAVVDYNSMDGLLKCTPHVNQHNNEIAAINTLRDVLGSINLLRIPKILSAFQTNDGYHCLVLSVIKGYSLREYISMIPKHLMDEAIAAVAIELSCVLDFMYKNKFTHGNINPDSFEGSQDLLELPKPSIVKLKGYTPPEDYVRSEVDQRLRDTWMFGATLYFMVNGHPPYGYAYSKRHKTVIPVPTKELQQTMERVAKTGENSYPPIKTKNKTLAKKITWLLEATPERRAGADRVSSISDLIVTEYMPTKKKLLGLWGQIKSMLSAVGTPSWQAEPPRKKHVEDASTRYKNP
ncbi:kinase-like domain-containing protein [Thamnocephalis sphaerospora]|uniref:Kinase-like domain-containing protein n=1 Tax=Thamnocephalis sphaerospora TaxID=78915 RepID=A0A4P9XGT4_9FUNG|nr:kinase-like domain-containing protein [Thamnocephalis sphaerospora]|eukprot:RKP04853.1 kinase-like domain-containing protein [Thamnocephalis sphaerospora]